MGRDLRNSLCAIRPCGCAVWAICLKFSTAIFLQFFFAYTVTITDHFGPNFVQLSSRPYARLQYHSESESCRSGLVWGDLSLHWKSRGWNDVPSSNHTEVEPCTDSLIRSIKTQYVLVQYVHLRYNNNKTSLILVVFSHFWANCTRIIVFSTYFDVFFFLFPFNSNIGIFSRNLKTSKKYRKSKFWINSKKIMEKHRGNFKLLILGKLRIILKMFLSSFSEIVKKFLRKVGILCTNF